MRLNLGAGKQYIEGFTHVDLADYSHIDVKHDIRCLPMFKNNSADLIYCSHALQYFNRLDALYALKEWHRILKNSGVLRLAVPDFQAIIAVYLKYQADKINNPLEKRGILGPLYGEMTVGNKMIYHKTAYDFESLKNLLHLAKFKNVCRYDWRETIHEDHDDCSQAYIPPMDKENGVLISLNVEATK